MNRLTIIGNLTRDPESRTTQDNKTVCTFSVAVNRRKTQNNQQPEADFFRVSAWNQLGENCQKYLAKGRKVAVVGPVSVHVYTGQDGTAKANLEVTANEVEFLSSANSGESAPAQAPAAAAPASPAAPAGFTQVEDPGELPF